MRIMLRIKKWCAVIVAFMLLCQLSWSFAPLAAYADAAGTAPEPAPWKDSDRNYRVMLTMDNSDGEEDLTDFPVPVTLNKSTIDYTVTSETDLKFYNDDQTKELSYEVEKWDPNDESIVWVNVPLIHGHSSTDRIWLYYGGSTLSDSRQQAVWDPNFLLVYHFGERIQDYFYQPAAVEQYRDSTANNNTGLRQAAGASSSGPSYTLYAKDDPRYNMVGRYYESHRGYVRAKNGNVGDGEQQLTVSLWARANDYELSKLSYTLIARQRSADSLNQAYFMKLSGGKWSANLFTNDADPVKNGSGSAALNGGAVTADWTYFTLTYDKNAAGNNLKLYRDGVLVDSAARTGSLITTSGTSTAPLTISKSSDAGAAGGGYRGGVDEVRVSKVARSEAWVKAEYKSMKKNGRFILFGQPEKKNALQLTLLQPKQGETYFAPDLSLSGLASESAVIRYKLDANDMVTLNTAADDKTFQSILKELKSGAHTLYVEAASNASPSVIESKTVTFTIDGSKLNPSVVPESASGEQAQQSGDVTLRVEAKSPTGEPMDVSFYEKNVQFVKDFGSKMSTDAAYERTDSMDPPGSATITSETALPADALDRIKASDGSYYSSKSLSNYPYQRFDLTINNDLSGINELEVSWEGHSKEKVMLYAWNYSTSKWELIASRNGNSDNSDFKLTGTLNKSTMVNSTTKVAKLYVAATQRDTMLPGQKPGPDQYDFSFVWMTDTQLEAESFPGAYDASTQWIADNKDAQKIQYVIHTGDIVNTASQEYQWQNADHSMKILEDAGIPYGVIQGNHDMNNALYGKYFGAFRFAGKLFQGKPYYNEYNSWNQNHYDLISAGGVDFIIMYIGWGGFNQASVNWANQVLQQYKDRKAILAVHEYLLYSGTYGTDDYGGKKIMEQIVQPNSNIFMVLCGHNQSAYYNVKRIGGKVVYELLHDYQDAALGGAGYIRMMYFDLKKQMIYMVPYSPITNDNYGFFQEKHEFYTIPLNSNNEPIELATGYIGVKGSSLNVIQTTPAASDTGLAEYTWNQRAYNQPYTWYAVAKDSYGNQTKSEERTFTIAKPVIESIRLQGLAPMKVGERRSTVVEATYTDGSKETVNGFLLTSSKPEVASIDANGTVTAHAEGETIITASLGSLTTSYKLLVQAAPVTIPILQSIQLEGLKPSTVDDELQTVVSATYSDGSAAVLFDGGRITAKGLQLTNSNPEVASLDAATGKVKALKAGETVIAATYQALHSSYTLLIQAKQEEVDNTPKLQSLIMDGLHPLTVGEKGQATVFGLYSPNNQLVAIQDGLKFYSSYEQVAAIDNDGLVSALSPGRATITVTYNGLEASSELVVIADNTNGNNGGSTGGGKPSHSSGGGGGGGGGYVPPTVPGEADQEFVQKVNAGQLTAANGQGSAVIQVEEGKTQVDLPYSAVKSMNVSKVSFQLDWGSVTIPAESLQAAASTMTEEQLSQASLSLSYRIWDDELLEVLTELQNRQAVQITPAAKMIHMDWNSNPSTAGIGTSSQTAEIHFPLPPKANGKRLGLYRVNEDGQLSFHSPNRSSDSTEAVFTMSGSGDFVILEYNVNYFDVKEHWAAQAIGDLAARQLFQSMVAEPIVSASGSQGFYPDKEITRAEFAALLARMLELPLNGTSEYADIPSTAWYANEVKAAAKAGIVEGIGDHEFSPDSAITREQMATMLMRAWHVKFGAEAVSSNNIAFSDQGQISEWAKPSVMSAAGLHLLNGRAEGVFVPEGTTTRAEAAQVVHQVLFRNS
ncbi:Endo-1,4-beta-xylanase A precursor [Paenibacillus konkukensis]|uniref:Endo-1,4-beta-xylanase A n=2 Tax=Paenibacillus konkukensis TaxID=2020716 RepID=A0ABY4RKT9_9BACL|nr:Endo-1,4-beta-xylanase A precursor [Paenibacillus konkukensis]